MSRIRITAYHVSEASEAILDLITEQKICIETAKKSNSTTLPHLQGSLVGLQAAHHILIEKTFEEVRIAQEERRFNGETK